MSSSAERLAKEAKSVFDSADQQNRSLTADERTYVQDLLDRAEQAREVEGRIKALSLDMGGHGVSPTDPNVRHGGQRPGDVFIDSPGYKAIRESSSRGGSWSSGPVEVPYATKTALLEGTGDAPGTGGALVQPDVQAGVQSILFQPVVVTDMLGQATTVSNTVRVITETVASNAAQAVAEGAEKPEAAIEFDEVDEPVRKFAVFMPLSDEILEDSPMLQTYLNQRLGLFVNQELEAQVVSGHGAGAQLVGLLNRVPEGNQAITSAAANATAVDHVFAALTKARESYLEPDGIAIHPQSWSEMRLLKDSTYNYLAGSPFSTGAGEPGETLFGKRVAITTAIPAGQALVGAFSTAATLYRRGGLVIEVANQHDVFFKFNKVAVRAECRAALAVHRPEAFSLADLEIS